jgi:AsmA protein
MDVKAVGGRLEVNPFSANLYQGRGKGSASVNANNNQLAIKQDLSGVSIGPLLRDALNQDLLDGRGNVALEVTATGNTVSAIKKSLNGSAALNLKDGALKGINLAQSLRNAKAMFTGGTRDSEQAAAAGEKTDFSELSASFVIRDGVAHNDDLLVKSPFLRLTGAGDINIAEGSLNYLAKAAAVATSTGQGGKELADTRGLTLPVRASGPFTALKYKLEFGSAFSDSAKQQVEAKKEELKGKLEDQLKSRLPGAAKPTGEAAPATREELPPPRPEDKLKEKLKKLF